MSGRSSKTALAFQLSIFSVLMAASISLAQDGIVDFESDRWEFVNARVADHLGRRCLAGSAYLRDMEFENGVIEVDIAVNGSRSYPGIIFRMQDSANAERFYIRPHRAGLYPDALQYTPVINGVSGWQLYHGDGCTAGATIPADQWLHLRVEINGTQARVFLGDGDVPALEIHDLKRGPVSGSIGVLGPINGSAYFSNFSYRLDDSLEFEAPPEIETPPFTITEWEISGPFEASRIDIEEIGYPGIFTIFAQSWQGVLSDASGLVDISRYAERSGQRPDCILARTLIRSDSRQTVKLSFGYSDEVSIFLNGRKLFYGDSSYQGRDRSFLGVVGLNDAVYLPLEMGLNEIFLMVKESFGGWGFICRLDREPADPARDHSRLTRVWETPDILRVPESVLYDPDREVLYVSSYFRLSSATANRGFISKVGLDGEIEELEWVTGLDGPCGMALYENRLYVVESTGNLVEIDADSGTILERYPITDAGFLNDLIVDSEGRIYISDSRAGVIYRVSDGALEAWLSGPEIDRPNGLFIHENSLIVGNTGDCILKSADLDTRVVSDIACLGAGVIDGIRVDNEGNYLVSLWKGQTYLVSPSGEVLEILNLSSEGLNIADFEFVREQNLLVIPTFMGNRIVAYRLTEE